MSGSPEMLFPDDDVVETPLPPRPRGIAQPIARRSSAVAPSDRRLAFSPGGIAKGSKTEHVTIPVKSNPWFYDPTGRKLLTNKSAFRINPDSEVRSPLRKGAVPPRAQGPYMPGGRHRTKKAKRRNTRRAPKSRRRRV